MSGFIEAIELALSRFTLASDGDHPPAKEPLITLPGMGRLFATRLDLRDDYLGM